jgi:beta-glucosidase
MVSSGFPADFCWGVATSAYQIEGGIHADGRGPSIWDTFAHTPGRTAGGANGDAACEHYLRWPADLQLMTDLGVQAYRFSIAWPRILPTGTGQINQAGLDFYRRLVDGLLEAGITPYATLYHWDLPQPLEDAGGWPLRATAEAFAEYAGVVAHALGDVVTNWITINEPWCVSLLSYQIGAHAPGRRSWPNGLAASHHVLLAHGLGVAAIRSARPNAQVGITLNFTHVDAASADPADRAAANRYDGYFNRWFLDPVCGRGYPADMVAAYTAQGYLPAGMAFVQPGDLAQIAAPTDFFGVNYYTREVVCADPAGGLWQMVPAAPATPVTTMGWELHPDGLYRLLMRLYTAYDLPKIYITENGVSYLDGPGADGQVRDQRRIAYLASHLRACAQAISSGAPLAGYFYWSLLDNFEWDRGYTQRFGIVHVDYDTQQRTPKASFAWYRDLIRRNGLPEAEG